MATTKKVSRLLEATSLPRALVDDLVGGASPVWLMGQTDELIAGDLALCHPALHASEVRAIAWPMVDGTFRVSVVCGDRPGLLATTAGALARSGFTITSASANTWPDLALAVQRLVLQPIGAAPDEQAWRRLGDHLRDELGRGNAKPAHYEPVPPVTVEAMDQGSDRTMVRVRATDRPGLLWAIAAWFQSAGCNIEVASISTVDGVATDTFVVTGAVDANALAARLSGDDAGWDARRIAALAAVTPLAVGIVSLRLLSQAFEKAAALSGAVARRPRPARPRGGPS